MTGLRNIVRLSCLVLAAAILGGCASGPPAWSDVREGADFSAYESWTFVEEAKAEFAQSSNDAPVINELNAARIREALRVEMAARGYREVDSVDEAGLAVGFTIGTRERVRYQSFNSPFATTGFGLYSRHVGLAGYGRIDVESYTEGTVAVDIFDAGTAEQLWHGWSRMRIHDGTVRETLFPQAIAAIMGRFPGGQRMVSSDEGS